MPRGINKAIIVGHLGADPEMRHMPSGGAVANVNVATSEEWKDKQTGEQKKRTEWHRVVFFNRLAEIADQYLRKGSQVYIEGRIQTRKWEKDGVDRYTTEIVAHEMQMLGGKGERTATSQSSAREYAAASQGGTAAPPGNMNQPGTAATTPVGPDAPDFDDDIPF